MKRFYYLITLLTLFLMLGRLDVSAQTTQDKEVLTNTLSQELSAPREKVRQVLSLISTTGQKMLEVSRDKALTKDEKIARCKQLGAERDEQIALLLTKEQIKKLEAHAAAQRSKMPQPRK
jgi:hypothetical protein